jgi:dihydropteroate synthase
MVKIPGMGVRTIVMGILNVTPDSFSDGGKFDKLESAVLHARAMIEAGADILDIGGESTRPGFAPVSPEAELERVIPIIEAIRRESDIPISIDTYKAEVAKQAIEAGADIINDIWRGIADPNMMKVAANLHVPIILMHNRKNNHYNDLIQDIISDLNESIQMARSAGVREEDIWLDPGIGFAKDYEQNLQVMAHLDKLVEMGNPVLLATSRKSMIGTTLDLPATERLEGTLATVCYGIQKGCQAVRVHDVKETVRVCRMMDAMIKREERFHGQNSV